MQEIVKILLGIAVLFLGIFIGNLLAKFTEDELKAGQNWFRRIVILSLAGAIISLIIKNDILLFTFLFITMITSKSIKVKYKTQK
jgi:hypothetical protein